MNFNGAKCRVYEVPVSYSGRDFAEGKKIGVEGRLRGPLVHPQIQPVLMPDRIDVPFLDLAGQHARLRPELDAAWRATVDGSAFIMGEPVEAFESELAAYMESRFACGVSNCTAALMLSLRALKLAPGDEVITTVHTAIATAEAITLAGGTVVFADIDPESWLVDLAQVESPITPRTRALLPVHLYGMPLPIDEFVALAARRGLALIEDLAQAQGARFAGRRVGTFGLAGCLSFFPSKNLGGFGDGGAVITDDADLSRYVSMYRNHGRLEKFTHEIQGGNERLDGLQAAILRVKLHVLDEWNARRRQVADWYAEELAGLDEIVLQRRTPGAEPVWHLFVVQTERRDALAAALKQRGIGTGLHYPMPLNLQPAFAHLGQGRGAFPVAERLCDQVLSLPMDPFLTREQVAAVADAVRRACESSRVG